MFGLSLGKLDNGCPQVVRQISLRPAIIVSHCSIRSVEGQIQTDTGTNI